MRQLRTCDFCGDEAAGVFEVLPPELDPEPAEQRRTVLCADCSARLETLLEPLLARASDSATSASAADSSGAEEEASRTTEAVASSTAASTDRDDEQAADGDANAARAPDRGDRTSTESPEPSADSAADETGRESTTDDAEPGADASGSADDSATDAADETESAAATAAASSERTSARSSPDATEGRRSSRAPKAYGKAMRLLSNRELPMGRDEVESLIAGAYDLETHEVEAVVDHGVEMGRLRENDGQLYRA